MTVPVKSVVGFWKLAAWTPGTQARVQNIEGWRAFLDVRILPLLLEGASCRSNGEP